jgi:hypothetical protein
VLIWEPTIQYSLDEITEIALITKSIYAGSMTVTPVPFVQLFRRRGEKIYQKDILCGADASRDVVNQINSFLIK